MNGTGRTVTWTRHEWVLSNPEHWSEVDKAVGRMRTVAVQLSDAGARCDDVMVTGQDEELVVWFDEHRAVPS